MLLINYYSRPYLANRPNIQKPAWNWIRDQLLY